MSNENQDANLGAVDSSAQPTPEAENAGTPDAANASQDQSKGNEGKSEQTPFHEHPRFKELINEKNQLRSQIAELQSQLTGITNKKEDPLERVVQRYVKAGMKEDAARLLAEGSAELAGAKVEERIAPVEASSIKAQHNLAFNQFTATHKDFDELAPQMDELFQSLPEPMKMGLASDPQGLQFLYDRVKSANVEQEIKKAFEKGVQEGYKRKSDKSAVTPSSGASVGTPKGSFSEEDINNMSLEEYMKNRKTILASKSLR